MNSLINGLLIHEFMNAEYQLIYHSYSAVHVYNFRLSQRLMKLRNMEYGFSFIVYIRNIYGPWKKNNFLFAGKILLSG